MIDETYAEPTTQESVEKILTRLEQRIDELEKRQYEFLSILRDIVDVVKTHREMLDVVAKAEGAAKSKS